MTHQKFLPFENFLETIGFKRVEGTIFGLLSLSDHPLSQEEIEKELGLSQSAISQALKRLSHFGAIDTSEYSKECASGRAKRLKVYSVKKDGLTIVATVFRKREQPNIEEFKNSVAKLLNDYPFHSPTALRLRSIVLACEIAESVMDFVIKLSRNKGIDHYEKLVDKLPTMFELLLQGSETFEGLKHMKGKISQQLINSSKNFFGGNQ